MEKQETEFVQCLKVLRECGRVHGEVHTRESRVRYELYGIKVGILGKWRLVVHRRGAELFRN